MTTKLIQIRTAPGTARKHRAGGSGPEMFLRGATKRKAAWKAAKA